MNRVYLLGGLRSHIGVRYGVFKTVRPEVLGGAIVKALCENIKLKGPMPSSAGTPWGPEEI